MSEKNISFLGKVAKFPKNTKVKNAFNFLENIKVSKSKLWYILIEKDNNGIQVIKYNNKNGFMLYDLINELCVYYSNNSEILPHLQQLKIEGEDKFTTIYNIPDIEIDGKKLITILTTDLIKLLYK